MPMPLDEYVDCIRDARLVFDMFVGALRRLLFYPEQGFMIEQPVSEDVLEAYEWSRRGGFANQLLTPDKASP